MGNIALKYLGLGFFGSSTKSSLQYQEISQGGKNLKRKAAETENVKGKRMKNLQLTNENRMSKEETAYISDIKFFFPPEIISEILSFLPVKSVLRMRCVCKSWHDLTRDRDFIEKHMNKGPPCYVYNVLGLPLTASSKKIIHSSDGLFLKRGRTTGKYCITNQATKQILDLPNPHKNSLDITLSFVPSIGQYKLVSIYDATERGTFGEICEILTAGIDNSWRPLKIPKSEDVNRKRKTISVVAAGAVVHCIRVSNIGSNICREIISLDLESESFKHAELPEDLFPYGSEIWPLNWNGQLAFAYRVQKDLNVLVFESYKKLKCSETKIVLPLQFESILLNNLVPLCARSGDLWFRLKENMIFSYDIASGKVSHKILPRKGCKMANGRFYVGTDSLVTLRGMKPYVQPLQRSLVAHF